MKYQTQSRIRHLLWLPLLVMLSLAGSFAHASNASISCTGLDTEDPQCTLDGSTSEGFLNLIQDVLESADNVEVSSGVCTRDFGQDQVSTSFTCVLPGPNEQTPGLTFECEDAEGGGGATCTLPDVPAAYFSLDCNTATDPETGLLTGGSCDVNSDETAVRATLIESGLSDNAASVGANLFAGCALRAGYIDDAPTAFQRDCDAVLALLGSGQDAQAAALLEEITPHNVDVAIDTTAQIISQQLQGVAGRMARLRQNQRGMDVAGLRFFDGLHWVNAGSLMASNAPVDADAPAVVAFGDSRLGVFVDGALLSGSQDEDATAVEGETEYDGQTFTLGIDYRITDALIAGVAYSLGVTSTDFSGDRGSLDSTNYSLLGYGTYYKDAWYVEGTLAAGSDRYEQDRRMRCDLDTCGMAFDVLASSEYYGDQTAISLATGYGFNFNALTVTPNLQWSQMNIDTDAYEETTVSPTTETGTGFLLGMDDQSRDHNTVSVGVDTTYAISTTFGVIQPHVSLDLFNELDDDVVVVNGQFLGGTANEDKFALTTRELDSSYYVLGVGSSLQLSGGGSGFVDVRSLLGYEDASQWQLRAGWRWEM